MDEVSNLLVYTLYILNNIMQDLKISIYSAALDLYFWVKRHAQN